MNQKEFSSNPASMAFKRGYFITDAKLFAQNNGKLEPIYVTRHGIRGTQNVNTDDIKEISQIQLTDSAKLNSDTGTMVVTFDLRFLPLVDALHSMAEGASKIGIKEYRQSIDSFIDRAINSQGVSEISRRFARNILNGRWLWRNRAMASSIEIMVTKNVGGQPGDSLHANALRLSLKNFKDFTQAEVDLGAWIEEGIKGESTDTLTVTATLNFGVSGVLEVFPSQNYVSSKPKGLARLLYYVGQPLDGRSSRTPEDYTAIRYLGQAAIRDQKVANAIRTIDDWYEGFEEIGQPIAVEPIGANLEYQTAFRNDESSSFDMARRLNNIDPASSDGMFMIANLIRGGVYTTSNPEKAEKAVKATKTTKSKKKTAETNEDEAG